MNIALQLYTLKDLIEKNGIEYVLGHVFEIGYEGVELYTPIPKRIIERSELKVVGCVIDFRTLKHNTAKVFEYCASVKCPTVSISGFSDQELNSKTIDDVEQVLDLSDDFNIELLYHIHGNEFKENFIYKFLSSCKIKIEPDIYWLYLATDYLQFLEQYSQRCVYVHLRDIDTTGAGTEIGTGIINIDEVIRILKDTCKWYVVEQEEFKMNKIESIKKSFEQLRDRR
jgi:sugar phosphate isomerase/epimerase